MKITLSELIALFFCVRMVSSKKTVLVTFAVTKVTLRSKLNFLVNLTFKPYIKLSGFPRSSRYGFYFGTEERQSKQSAL